VQVAQEAAAAAGRARGGGSGSGFYYVQAIMAVNDNDGCLFYV
jgi:hypothetical protein